jgi:hypothetical protein
MKIKPAVKLDLGEMCKLRLLFFVSRENFRSSISYFIWQDLIDNLYIYIFVHLSIFYGWVRIYIYTRSSLEKLDVC